MILITILQHIKTVTIQNINCKLLSIIIFYFWYYTETRIESNMDRAYVYILLTQLHWSIRLGAGSDRTWFEDTPLSQLARGIYYFARNQFEHAKWLRGRTRCIPNNYLGESHESHDWARIRKFRSWNFRWLLFPYFSSRLVSWYEYSASHSSVSNIRQLRRFTTDSDSSKLKIRKIETRHRIISNIRTITIRITPNVTLFKYLMKIFLVLDFRNETFEHFNK